MKRFYCHCGQEVYFGNSHCNTCGSQLGFDPGSLSLHSMQQDGDAWRIQGNQKEIFHTCSHRDHSVKCNWLLSIHDSNQQCIACRLTRTIPNLSYNNNVRRWSIMESSKRRTIYGLLQLNIFRLQHSADGGDLLTFDFLEDQRSNPEVAEEHVNSGHANGIITMNVAEADDSYREATKEAMNEPYRSLLGHFRHELGHFYWDRLIKDSDNLTAFRQLFGDESRDYRATLETYYLNGPSDDWRESYISAYASAHPMEDWAETWAHYMLMTETLETAKAYQLLQTANAGDDFNTSLKEWTKLVLVMNALNRSTGNSDAYPFVIPAQARKKLNFIHQLVHQH